MDAKGEVDVLVVGAGPVGLFTALCLARRGVRVLIVDEGPQTTSRSYALALHADSLDLMAEVGLLDRLRQRGHAMHAVAFYDGPARCGQLRPAEAADRPMLLVLPQSELEELLEKRLASLGVQVAWDHRVSDLHSRGDHVVCMIDRLADASTGYAIDGRQRAVEKILRFEVPFVIGADGHQSFVRRMLHIGYPVVGQAESFAVFEFQNETPPLDEVRVVFDGHSTSALWSLPGGRQRWSFELLDKEAPSSSRCKSRVSVPVGSDVFPLLSARQLKAFIQTRAPWYEGNVGELHWSLLVRFERRLAERFGQGRFWLAGDAAHLAGPVGVHSLNMGLREGADLAAGIHDVLHEGAPLERLETCSRTFHDEWCQLLDTNASIRPTTTAETWVHTHYPRIAPCIPATGATFRQYARQLGLEFLHDGLPP